MELDGTDSLCNRTIPLVLVREQIVELGSDWSVVAEWEAAILIDREG